MKTLKFKPELIDLMRKGEKTATWRLFDDKDLTKGDRVELIDWETQTRVGTATLGTVLERPLGELFSTDPDGHEKYTSKEEMLATYRGYYGNKVTLDTPVKVIHLKNILIESPQRELVFFDGEFSSLNPYVGELVSFGVVKESGEELYCELEYDGEYSEWMKENLVHTLTAPKVSRQQARDMLRTFVGDLQPYVCAFVNHFDTVYLAKLFAEDIRKGETTLGPFHWMPIDFASVLYAHHIDPERFPDDQELLATLNIDTKKFKHTHHALDDARMLREAWRGLMSTSTQ